MLNFETWQQIECQRLGISVEDHNKILEVSRNFEATGFGCPYDSFIRIIESPPQLTADFAALEIAKFVSVNKKTRWSRIISKLVHYVKQVNKISKNICSTVVW